MRKYYVKLGIDSALSMEGDSHVVNTREYYGMLTIYREGKIMITVRDWVYFSIEDLK